MMQACLCNINPDRTYSTFGCMLIYQVNFTSSVKILRQAETFLMSTVRKVLFCYIVALQ